MNPKEAGPQKNQEAETLTQHFGNNDIKKNA